MRQVFVQRHGEAARPSEGGERQLTAAGRQLLRGAVAGLRRAGVALAAIAHSPLARTRDTAAEMAPLLVPEGALFACPALAPGGMPEDVAAWLEATLPLSGPRLLVGHMPEVADWTALWSGEREVARRGLAPGSMARLDLEGRLAPSSCRLAWVRDVAELAVGI